MIGIACNPPEVLVPKAPSDLRPLRMYRPAVEAIIKSCY